MRRLALIGLAIWSVAVLALGALLLLPHVLALPTPPTTDARLGEALASRFPAAQDRWRAAHIMYRSCACSQRTIAHLLERERPANLAELVVMVDDAAASGPEDAQLRAAGFRVELVTPAVLDQQFNVQAVPLLVIAEPSGRLVYSGGYNRRKQSSAYEDVQIIADLQRKASPAALPVFGCATSARLADAIDPLGLRQW